MTTTGPRQTRDGSAGTAYGVSVFAGVLLATLGSFQVLQGVAAVLEDDIFVTGLAYTYEIDLTTWGWVTMLLGAVGLAVGIGILKGQSWAASAGIGFAVLSAVGQFAFMPYYPFWAALIIALDVLVIWALAQQIAPARGAA
ncbi:hypothetical protein ENKNEFLB_00198 [Nocardioides aquaticus]|uniref:DUF7144 domain-containing protein n=1 Tax=Nocardioides aquaticus TaxID=160826 RepID=A0ABX8EBW2_9ACTN|nr:hypothetical protein [Nocardioides aquaticus]QVT77829.1 hypothetical protein ENKNEFLB_00198 [Nocardioides aquaticus]